MVEFNNKSRPKRKIKKKILVLYEGRGLTLNAFKSGIFPIKSTQTRKLKILTPKQMLQRLPIVLT